MSKEFDPWKSAKNARERGLPFSKADDFDWATAEIVEDIRFDYPERRWVATGYIGNRIHVIIYCYRGEDIRIIGLRKANRREVVRYEKTTN